MVREESDWVSGISITGSIRRRRQQLPLASTKNYLIIRSASDQGSSSKADDVVRGEIDLVAATIFSGIQCLVGFV